MAQPPALVGKRLATVAGIERRHLPPNYHLRLLRDAGTGGVKVLHLADVRRQRMPGNLTPQDQPAEQEAQRHKQPGDNGTRIHSILLSSAGGAITRRSCVSHCAMPGVCHT